MTAQPLAITPELASEIDRVIDTALREDLLGPASRSQRYTLERDITTSATVPAYVSASATMLAKVPGTIAGLPIAERVFKMVDPKLTFEALINEGETVANGRTPIAKISGSARSLLVAERTALNLIQRLSGIATITSRFSALATPKGIAVLDTRKTTPGMRAIEKYAVVVGGGTNHRFGLFDAILIKDNHISIAGGITHAIEKSRERFANVPVEVEVSNLDQLNEAVACKAEKILLDNMTPDMVRECVQRVNKRAFIEVSGGITEETFPSYLIEGVDAISIGALTHSVKSLDISMDIATT